MKLNVELNLPVIMYVGDYHEGYAIDSFITAIGLQDVLITEELGYNSGVGYGFAIYHPSQKAEVEELKKKHEN